MRLTYLSVKDFPPFTDSVIEFPAPAEDSGLAEVQMITGENGTGKTRVLAALMASLGSLAALEERVRTGSSAELQVGAELAWTPVAGDAGASLSWKYRNGAEDVRHRNFLYQVETMPALAGTGMALLSSAEIAPGAAMRAATADESLNLSGPAGGPGIVQRLFNLRMQVALEREGGGAASAGSRLTASLRKLEHCIAEITERSFSIQIQMGKQTGLVFQWEGTPLYLSELPDGLRSLLNWLAGWVVLQTELYERSSTPLDEPVILLLDEPENHLHPAWQRRVLPALQRLFPNAQIFLVTHSPFIICSLNQGWIHKLERGTDGKVAVAKPVPASKGDSYISALETIMGIDRWFDPETEGKLDEFRSARDRALRGDDGAFKRALLMGKELEARGPEVADIMARELRQMERLVAQAAVK